MVMGDVFHEMWAYETTDEEEELDPYDPFQNTGDIPVPAGVPQTAYQAPLNPNVGGFRQSEMIPDPNATTSDPFTALGRAYEAVNPQLPYASEFLQEAVPWALNSIPGVGAASVVSEAFGGPDIGQTISDVYGGDYGAADIGTIIAPGVGDVPVDDIWRGVSQAPGMVDNVLRPFLPEPNPLGANFGAGPPMNPMGGENVYGYGVHGATPDDAAILASQREATLNNPGPWAPDNPGITIGQNAPPPPAPYPSMPEGTIGSEFPDVVGQPRWYHDLATDTWRQSPVKADAPASAMGAPLAYDPQFMGPPPGVAAPPPVADELTADDIGRAWENSRRQEEILTGGGTGNQLPASPGGLASQPPPASNIDQLISEAQPTTPSFPMTNEEALAEAQRIGFPVDEGALTRGTTLARQEEMDRLSAAIDLDNFRRGSTDQWVNSYVNAVRDGGTPPPPPPGAPPNPLKGDGPPPSVAANPQAMGLWDVITDLSYGTLQMDVGTPLRQDLTAMLDLTKIGQTRAVLGDAVRAATSRDEAIKVIGELDTMLKDAETRAGVTRKIDLQRPDIPGIRETRGNVSREVMQSNLFGRIPGIGLPYNVTGRANAMVLESRRVRDYVDFLNSLPDRRGASYSGEKLNNVAQYFANQRAVMTGRGSLGPQAVEKALSKAGPAFTSLRFLLSIPQRVPYLLPVNRIASGQWEVLGPAWREAAKEHAVFATALGGTLLAAEQAGLDVRDKAGELTGKITIGGTTHDLTAGMAAYWNAIQKMADGDLMAGAEFLRNKSSPMVQAGVQGLRLAGVEGKFLDFMRPEWFDKGATGSGTPADRAAAMIVPLWMQSVAQSVRAAQDRGDNPVVAGVTTGVSNFFGTNTRSSSFVPNPLSEMRKGVLGPSGIEYRDLMPNEQASLNKALEGQYGEKYTKAAQESTARLDPAIRNYQTQRDQVYKDSNAQIQRILEGVQNGAYDFRSGRIAMQALDKDAGAKVNELRRDPAYQKAIDEFPDREKSVANKALDVYRAIPNQYKDANGKINWDGVEAKRAEFLNAMSPALRERLEKEINTPSENDHPYIKMLKAENDMVGRYKSLPDAEELALRRANPFDDAKLVYMGYSAYPLTPQAAAYLQALAPGYAVNVGRR